MKGTVTKPLSVVGYPFSVGNPEVIEQQQGHSKFFEISLDKTMLLDL
jgi:hypothetical protein